MNIEYISKLFAQYLIHNTQHTQNTHIIGIQFTQNLK